MENETKWNPLRTNRVLYIAVVAVLCVAAIVVGIVAAASRSGTTTTPPPTGTEKPGSDTGVKNPDKETGGNVTPEKTEFLSPIAGTVSRRHDTDTLVFSSTMGDWRVHTGMDITAKLGDTVSASADGVVKDVWDDALMGKCVSISHAGNVVTVYKNLGETLAEGIAAGKSVKAGAPIGTVGESALCEMADEPHLHFEMTVNGSAVDPLSYLSEASRATSLKESDKNYEDSAA